MNLFNLLWLSIFLTCQASEKVDLTYIDHTRINPGKETLETKLYPYVAVEGPRNYESEYVSTRGSLNCKECDSQLKSQFSISGTNNCDYGDFLRCFFNYQPHGHDMHVKVASNRYRIDDGDKNNRWDIRTKHKRPKHDIWYLNKHTSLPNDIVNIDGSINNVDQDHFYNKENQFGIGNRIKKVHGNYITSNDYRGSMNTGKVFHDRTGFNLGREVDSDLNSDFGRNLFGSATVFEGLGLRKGGSDDIDLAQLQLPLRHNGDANLNLQVVSDKQIFEGDNLKKIERAGQKLCASRDSALRQLYDFGLG